MGKRTLLQKFLLGSEYIESRKEYEKMLLRGQFGSLLGTICLFYLVLDSITGFTGFLYLYIIGFVISALVVFFNRIREGAYSGIILILFSNIFVFFIVDSGLETRGSFFYFMPTAAAGILLFHLSNIKLSIGFVLLSIALGIGANYNENPLLVFDSQPEYMQKLNFAINFTVGIVSTVVIFLFVIKRDKKAEDSLQKSKRSLEKLRDELIRKNSELEKVNKELDQFVYSASHDMRAPLATLQGLINVASISNVSEYPTYFKLMSNRIEDMEGFVKEVTNYSTNTRLKVENTHINIRKTITDLIDKFHFLAHKLGVGIETNIAADLTVNTDLRRLKIVLSNIIDNAIKYSDHLKTEKFVKIAVVINDKKCVIEIEDNGIGIDPNYQHKVFNMFYRASETSKGSGLGLYIVSETLQKLQGKIQLFSTLTKGTRFVVEIPVDANVFSAKIHSENN